MIEIQRKRGLRIMIMKFFKWHSRGRYIALVLILTYIIGTDGYAQASASWPNEPANSTLIMDCDFTSLTCGGALTSVYNGFNVGSQSSPLSSSSVLEMRRSFGAGPRGDVLYRSLNQSSIYVGMWFKINAGFDGNINQGNKLFFIKTNNDILNAFWGLVGAPGGNPFELRWNAQANPAGNPIDNSHLSGAAGVYPWVRGNLNAACSVSKDTWYRIEILQTISSTTTSQNGTLDWWITPLGGSTNHCAHYTNVNAPGPINVFQYDQTWQGVTDPAQTQDWYEWVDHLHISIPGGGGAGADISPPMVPAGLQIR